VLLCLSIIGSQICTLGNPFKSEKALSCIWDLGAADSKGRNLLPGISILTFIALALASRAALSSFHDTWTVILTRSRTVATRELPITFMSTGTRFSACRIVLDTCADARNTRVLAVATDKMLLFEEIVVISEGRSWFIKAEPWLGMVGRGCV
jgi:hypothetical protein